MTEVGNGSFVVTEGNMSGGKVGKRTMKVNGRYIRGFICPKFAEIARELTAREEAAKPTEAPQEETPQEDTAMDRFNAIKEMPPYATATISKLVEKKFLTGYGTKKDEDGRPADLDLSVDMLRMLVVLDRAGVFGE